MKINRLINDKGEFRCFEVDNTIISRSGMAEVISNLQGVKVHHYPKYDDVEVFCIFELGDYQFNMTEPYGDSSVYDVVSPAPNLAEMNKIAEHFEISDPIKGGDSGHNAFFIANWLLFTGVAICICYAIWSIFKNVFL